jgi:hypothetical protein
MVPLCQQCFDKLSTNGLWDVALFWLKSPFALSLSKGSWSTGSRLAKLRR